MTAAGQESFAGALDLVGLDEISDRLEAEEVARSAGHARVLADVLAFDAVLCAAGMGLSTSADLALRLRCSSWRTDRLLEQARVLSGLPDGLGVLSEGLLTVEQLAVFVTETARLSGETLLRVWQQLVDRLRAAAAAGEMLPPGRLTPVLRRWVLQAAPLDAVEQRKRGQDDARVEVRRRDDGLVNLYALGVTAPLAHACLSRISAAAGPVGPDDTRSADRRRLDALVDLLAGRIALPLPGLQLDPPTDPSCAGPATAAGVPAAGSGCRDGAGGGCPCPNGAPVPCGADVQVLVPIGATLGTTDELAELIGGGALDPDLLARLLLAAPRLRAVWVDEHGVPLSTGSHTRSPQRGDPADLRVQLLALAAQVPAPPEPRHPNDHPPAARPATARTLPEPPAEAGPEPDAATDPPHPSAVDLPRSIDAASSAPGSGPSPAAPAWPWSGGGGAPHPAGTPGPYRVPERLRRLLTARRPLCEWPACGTPARRCDMEHDIAWPDGPTCGCALGPCCRRHHRIKQLGWTKTRTAIGVAWTGPTGRSWSSPTPHQPPARPVRQLPPLPTVDPLAGLGRSEVEQELWHADPASSLFDGAVDSGRCDDTDPPDHTDRLRERLLWTGTTWTLDLQDVDNWQDLPHPPTAERNGRVRRPRRPLSGTAG